MAGDLILQNLISPITIAFAIGIVATVIRSDLEIPEPVIKLFAIFLLLSIGIQGGRELATAPFGAIAKALVATLALVLILPCLAFLVARYWGRFDPANAAGIAALYGSVSSVTYLAAVAFAQAQGLAPEGYLAALVALMECGILVALFLGRLANARMVEQSGHSLMILAETLRGRGFVLLVGGLVMGMLIGETNHAKISPFFVDLFRGVLVIFILEMGMSAARQLRAFLKVGPFMLGFGMVVPLVFGLVGTLLGTWAGLSVGGAFVLGAVAGSASYIDAPAAVRAAFPEANPSIYLTSSLAITFPFNLVLGLPIYFGMASFWARWLNG